MTNRHNKPKITDDQNHANEVAETRCGFREDSLWDDVVILPSIAHLENKLLPEVRDSTEAPMAVVDDAGGDGKA